MKKLIQHICTSLADGQDLVLVTIASQSGSTPPPGRGQDDRSP